MKRSKLMDLYTDFLTSSPNVASTLVFAKVLNDTFSYDAITRMLGQPEISQKKYWQAIKKLARQIESDEGVISPR